MNQHQYSCHEISDADDHSEDGQLRTPHFMDTGGDDRNNRYGIILIWQSINFFSSTCWLNSNQSHLDGAIGWKWAVLCLSMVREKKL